MREIKFRAWDKKYNTMTSFEQMMSRRPFAIADGLDPEQFIVLPYHENIVLIQFTGIKGKGGVEVYEGDRIKFQINFSDEKNKAYWSEDGFIGSVVMDTYRWVVCDVMFTKMHDSGYVFGMQGRSFDRDLLKRYSSIKKASFNEISRIEVIGNIHEPKPQL